MLLLTYKEVAYCSRNIDAHLHLSRSVAILIHNGLVNSPLQSSTEQQ